jgi:hypothetical protein
MKSLPATAVGQSQPLPEGFTWGSRHVKSDPLRLILCLPADNSQCSPGGRTTEDDATVFIVTNAQTRRCPGTRPAPHARGVSARRAPPVRCGFVPPVRVGLARIEGGGSGQNKPSGIQRLLQVHTEFVLGRTATPTVPAIASPVSQLCGSSPCLVTRTVRGWRVGLWGAKAFRRCGFVERLATGSQGNPRPVMTGRYHQPPRGGGDHVASRSAASGGWCRRHGHDRVRVLDHEPRYRERDGCQPRHRPSHRPGHRVPRPQAASPARRVCR